MRDGNSHPEQDPAEGSRETIDRQLADEGKADTHQTPRSDTSPEPSDPSRPQDDPAEGSRETVDEALRQE